MQRTQSKYNIRTGKEVLAGQSCNGPEKRTMEMKKEEGKRWELNPENEEDSMWRGASKGLTDGLRPFRMETALGMVIVE